MRLKTRLIRRGLALVMILSCLLSMNAAALFGKKEETKQPAEGAPIAQELEITTYRNIPYQSQFLATDGEGDDLTYRIVEEPRKGTVVIDGANFTYTPKDSLVGADRFTYAAVDSAGHESLPATVTVTIEKTRSGVAYADTDETTQAAAAQCLAEEGIFVGAQIGGKYYFEPDRVVSRGEFLAMVMETAGREVTEVTMTGFCDDEAIPTWSKAYASAGVADGIVQGKVTENGVAFRGEDTITLNEAATILDRVLSVGDVDLETWRNGEEAVPSWAAQAVGNMEAIQVIEAGSFGTDATERAVTRAEAAGMLSAAKTLLDGEENGLFAWLK